MDGVRGLLVVFILTLHTLIGSAACCEPQAALPPVEAADAGQRAEDLESQRGRALDALPEPRPRPEGFRRGVSLGLFVSSEDPEERRGYYERFLDEIRAVGATDVSLVVRWAQADVRATAIGPLDGVTVDDAVLVEVIEQARARGLRVFLLPILHLEHMSKGQWRGTLAPTSPEDWWAAYARFILHYAALSQRHGVGMLAVGSEMASMERHDARWRALIAQVREAFKGELTYSANWDHFEPVPFWDALDVVGVTAYQELSRRRDPDEASLIKGWEPFEHRLRLWASQNGHRYIFTEVGYPSNTLGAAQPWNHAPRGQADVELQLRCFRAMFQVWQGDERLDGLYVWNWFGQGGPEDRGYTPRGKPSRFVLEHWFKR